MQLSPIWGQLIIILYYDYMWRIQFLMAQIDIQQKDYTQFLRHIRLTLKYRHAIEQTDWALVRQYLSRRKMKLPLVK